MQVIVFRNRLRPGVQADYDHHAEEVYRRAVGMPGYVSAKDFIADDGERLALIEWDSAENLSIWRDDPDHRVAQQAGRDRYYAEYHLQICSELRSSHFDGSTWRKHDLRGVAERWLLGDYSLYTADAMHTTAGGTIRADALVADRHYEATSITADDRRIVIECEGGAWFVLDVRDGRITASRELRCR